MAWVNEARGGTQEKTNQNPTETSTSETAYDLSDDIPAPSTSNTSGIESQVADPRGEKRNSDAATESSIDMPPNGGGGRNQFLTESSLQTQENHTDDTGLDHYMERKRKVEVYGQTQTETDDTGLLVD